MARPKMLTMQYIVLFSQRTVQLPSVELSQKQEFAMCRPGNGGVISTSRSDTGSCLNLKTGGAGVGVSGLSGKMQGNVLLGK